MSKREKLIATAILLLFFTALAAFARAQKPGKTVTPRVTPSFEELYVRLEAQEQRIRQLESGRKGCFPFVLDSSAGKVECQDCKFQEVK